MLKACSGALLSQAANSVARLGKCKSLTMEHSNDSIAAIVNLNLLLVGTVCVTVAGCSITVSTSHSMLVIFVSIFPVLFCLSDCPLFFQIWIVSLYCIVFENDGCGLEGSWFWSSISSAFENIGLSLISRDATGFNRIQIQSYF